MPRAAEVSVGTAHQRRCVRFAPLAGSGRQRQPSGRDEHVLPASRTPAATVAVALLVGVGLTWAALAQPAESQPVSPEQRRQQLERAAGEMSRVQDRIEAELMIRRGAAFLLKAQQDDGGWASQTGPGISALVVKALARTPGIGPRHPAVKRGVRFVLSFQRPDGGIYGPDGLIKNYETSVALSMLAALRDPAYAEHVRKARAFLQGLQWDEGEDKHPDDVWYGGAGYGRHKRPDLSNTQMMLEALHDSGLPADDPTYRKALLFIKRCQMLGESNDQPFARGSTQGGFIYSPANGGESKAGKCSFDGREELRCYGSMTYAGLKSMLYCGLSKDDPRVKAAFDWITRNWTLDANPNMPGRQSKQGLFYYYHVFARALDAWGADVITDSAGRQHDWRHELVIKLGRLQKSDGSWVNDEDRWMEGIPALTTAYSLLALQAAFGP